MSELQPVAVDETQLAMELRAEKDGPVLLTEPVRFGDLQEGVAEIWFRAQLRYGAFGVDMQDMEVRLQPLIRESVHRESRGARCQGYVLQTTGGDGQETALTCSALSLYPLAQRCATELSRRGVLADGQTFLYELRAVGEHPGQSRPIRANPPPQGRILSRTRDTSFQTLPMAALLECSRAVGPAAGSDHQVFYAESALARAEGISRRGEQGEPRVETGGVLIGLLGWCPTARDAFVVIIDALEAQEANQSEFSLTFSGQTWLRIQAVLRARRAQPGNTALRIIGQTHGHPFSPGEPCPACPQTPECPKHTAFLSEEDRRWSRAVFAGQPWQVGHQWGINARGEPVAEVFGLCGGRLERRGYRVIPDRDLQRIRNTSTHGDDS